MSTKKLVLTPSIYLWILERMYVWLVNQIRFIIIFSKFKNDPKSYPLTILDIGCGDGFFLNDLPNTLFIKTGIDIDIPKRLPGITYHKGSFERVKLGEKFDVVVANHVIEHIAEPHEFIRKMYSSTKIGGVVLLSTPNGDSLNHKWFKNKWYHYNWPHHKFIFTKKSLSQLVRSAGFKEVQVKGEFPGFPMDIVRTLQSAGPAYVLLLPVLLIIKLFIPETLVLTAKK